MLCRLGFSRVSAFSPKKYLVDLRMSLLCKGIDYVNASLGVCCHSHSLSINFVIEIL